MWTDYRCVKCMSRLVQLSVNFGFGKLPISQCDGHCRVKQHKPHVLDPKAYSIDGEDSRTEREMLGEHKSLLDT